MRFYLQAERELGLGFVIRFKYEEIPYVHIYPSYQKDQHANHVQD